MASAIDRLIDEVWSCCIDRRPAHDATIMERWQSDPYAYIRESFVVTPLPPSLRPLVQDALNQWQGIEDRILDGIATSRDQFISEFENIRSLYLQGDAAWRTSITAKGCIVCGAVRNMEWVNLFSWILPTACPDLLPAIRQTGKMVTAVLHIEFLWKSMSNPADLAGIEARWRLAAS